MTRVPRQRRHILYFQRHLRAQSPFTITTSFDASAVVAHRAGSVGRRPSYLAYALHAVGRVLASHDDLNVVVSPGLVPRVRRVSGVRPKVAVDAVHDGVRAVFAVVLPRVDIMTLDEIDAHVERLATTPVDRLEETRGARALHRLPTWVGWPLLRGLVGWSGRQADLVGTVAVSSLGRHHVESFVASGGTPVTVNLGRVEERPRVVDGRVVVCPVWHVSLTCDHRVVDGARAGQILDDLRARLEKADVS